MNPMAFLGSGVQETSSEYIVRWPLWVGFLLGIAIMGSLYSLLAAWVRRVFGLVGLAVLAGLVAFGFAATIVSEWRREPSIGAPALVIATGACILGLAVAPAVTIWYKSRAPTATTLGKQVGWALLSIYGAFAAMALLTVLVSVAYRGLHR